MVGSHWVCSHFNANRWSLANNLISVNNIIIILRAIRENYTDAPSADCYKIAGSCDETADQKRKKQNKQRVNEMIKSSLGDNG